MTEQDLIDLEFKKITVTDEESQNGYDYCYYSKTLLHGFLLVSSDSQDVINDEWDVHSYEPDFTIEDIELLKQLIDVFSKIKN